MIDISEKYHNNKLFGILKIFWMMYVLFPFRWNGISFIQNILYYGISIICLCIFIKKILAHYVEKSYCLDWILYLAIFIFLMLLTYIIPIKKNTLDFSYFSNYEYYLGRLIILTGTVILVTSFIQYINLIINAINAYVLFSILLLIPVFHNAYLKIVDMNDISSNQISNFYSNDYYTRFGLQGFSGFGSTIMCAVAVLLGCYMIVNAVRNNEKKINYVFKVLLSVIGTAMFGRSGFLISLVIILITVLYLAFFHRQIMLLLYFIIGLIFALLLFILNANKLEQIDSIRWMFEGFFNYLDYGQFSTSSTNHLANMYIKPSLSTILYGDGYYTIGGQYYMQTDVGYLRPMLFWGIICDILYYSLMIPPLNSIGKFLINKDRAFFLISSIIFIFLFEFKGEVLLTYSGILYAVSTAILLYTSGEKE